MRDDLKLSKLQCTLNIKDYFNYLNIIFLLNFDNLNNSIQNIIRKNLVMNKYKIDYFNNKYNFFNEFNYSIFLEKIINENLDNINFIKDFLREMNIKKVKEKIKKEIKKEIKKDEYLKTVIKFIKIDENLSIEIQDSIIKLKILNKLSNQNTFKNILEKVISELKFIDKTKLLYFKNIIVVNKTLVNSNLDENESKKIENLLKLFKEIKNYNKITIQFK